MQSRIQDIEHFAVAMFRQSKFAPACGKGRIGRQRGNIKGPAFFEKGKAAFIHEIAMLDTTHPTLQAPIDGPRCIGMPGDIEISGLSLFDGSTDLFTRELDRIDAIRW